MRPIRIGTGAGYAGDRIDPAEDLARDGALDYLVFECLAERTIAMAQLAKAKDPAAGYDQLLERRMRAVLPHCVENGTRIVTNMGAANVRRAGEEVARIARDLGLPGLRVAVVEGDDVLDRLSPETRVAETGEPLSSFDGRLVSGNAYLGAASVVAALRDGADVVITGRLADPSLFVGPILHHFGWRADDWHRVGIATMVGHLMECGAQVTGGYFSDPTLKPVDDLDRLGFPIGELAEDGTFTLTKLPDCGGLVSAATCKEQLLYEVFDPTAYVTPDVVADFSGVRVEQIAPSRVRLTGATGRPAPSSLKVSVGYRAGFMAEAQISYAGSRAVDRARLALDVVRRRLDRLAPGVDVRFDVLGVDALVPTTVVAPPPVEATARVAALCDTRRTARLIGEEVEALYVNGPAGGGGARKTVEEVVAICSVFIDRARVSESITFVEA